MAKLTPGLHARMNLDIERMDEVVRRTKVVDAFVRGDLNALYLLPTVESIYLQLRNSL